MGIENRKAYEFKFASRLDAEKFDEYILRHSTIENVGIVGVESIELFSDGKITKDYFVEVDFMEALELILNKDKDLLFKDENNNLVNVINHEEHLDIRDLDKVTFYKKIERADVNDFK